jgi:GxxExxY protein
MKEFIPLSKKTENIAKVIVDSAYNVHKELGPGLLESVYQQCLVYELHKRGLQVFTEVKVPIVYNSIKLDSGLQLDILVENEIIIELKTVDEFHPVHRAQLMTYLKLTNNRLGFLINFNVPLIKQGIKRIII